MSNRANLKITLTAEQQALIEQQTGKRLAAVALQPEILEPRVAPGQNIS